MKMTIREDKECPRNQDPALCEAHWECWSHMQSCVIEPMFPYSPPWFFCYPLCSLKHYICWQGQDSISCACSLVNANPGDPCIGEWGKATILPEACCAWCSWGDRGANENCRGRVPVKREQHVQCFLQCRAFFIRSCSFALVKMVKRHALVM